MRPANLQARDLLRTTLARRPGVSAAALAAHLGVSVPTLHRLLQEQPAGIVAAGRARRTRYALARALRGSLAPLPLYEVQADGRAQQVAELVLLHPGGSHLPLQGSHWPMPDEPENTRDGWWEGLPYMLADMRPQGYLGRQLALAKHSRLGVAANPESWGDDDVVHVLARAGSDMSGSLILGQPAFERWQQRLLRPPALISEATVGARYGELAELAVAQGVPGSSAAGEFPKFPALREPPLGRENPAQPQRTPHVLVKFSGADGSSAAVQRWADLLVCEHLALEAARALPGVVVPVSRIVQHGGRTFLEVERFDRHGLFGRSPLVSLGTLDAALLGSGSGDWRVLVERLAAEGWLSADDQRAVQRLWWFGRLIANTDMHTGNLSFRPVARAVAGAAPRHGGALALAPLYDMLPMLFAPLRGGELPTRSFEPALPLPPEQGLWSNACAAALTFWQRAAADARISAAFRATCEAAAARLSEVAARL